MKKSISLSIVHSTYHKPISKLIQVYCNLDLLALIHPIYLMLDEFLEQSMVILDLKQHLIYNVLFLNIEQLMSDH
jgi:hypothetical protein